MFAAGWVGILGGLAWGFVFPINKNLWTSSYVLFTAGAALEGLALCYWLIDIRDYRRWGVASFGDPGSGLGESGLFDRWDHPGEGPHSGQVAEPFGVAEAAKDATGEHDPYSGGGDDDALRVGFLVEGFDPFLELGDLVVEVPDDPYLGAQVPGQLLEVESSVLPEPDGFCGSVDQLPGLFCTPFPAAGSPLQGGQTVHSEPAQPAGIPVTFQDSQGGFGEAGCSENVGIPGAEQVQERVETLTGRQTGLD